MVRISFMLIIQYQKMGYYF